MTPRCLPIRCLALLAACLIAACSPAPPNGPVVLAAASMQEALTDAADRWEAEGHARPVLSFAASPAVARQADSGAPADIVITADELWMDWLADRGALREGTRRDIAGNRLMVVRSKSAGTVTLNRPGSARLALADPAGVPAGRYAKASLETLGLWDRLQPRVIPAADVRAALALVERGEAELGVVYASDALASRGIDPLGLLPAKSHPPIRYPLAILADSRNADSRGFAQFLSSPAGTEIFVRHGFSPAP